MKNIYETETDLHVRSTCVYRKAEDRHAYADPEYTEKIDTETLIYMFKMGTMLVIDSDGSDGLFQYYKPIELNVSYNAETKKYGSGYITLGSFNPTSNGNVQVQMLQISAEE